MQLSDGVYFDMPEDTYHKLARFSASGVKDIRVDPLVFWQRSWLNPEKAEERENGDDTSDTIFKLKGRAYHCRLCEGKEAFEARYAFELDPAKFKDMPVFVTSDDIITELKAMGVGGYSKMKKAELVELLLDHNPAAIIWDAEVKKHAEANVGRTLIPAKWMKDITFGVAMIEKNPTLKHAFQDGFPEVAVLWTKTIEDIQEGGEIVTYKVPMKCKMDYLKPGAIVDYKGFGNSREKSIALAIIGAMAERKNHIQCAIYYEGGDEAAKAIKENRVFIYHSSQTEPDVCTISPDIDALATETRKFFYVFQMSGPAPVARGRIMERNLMTTDIGRIEYERAALTFAKCMAGYGSDPWVVPEPVIAFEDSHFPIYMTEGDPI